MLLHGRYPRLREIIMNQGKNGVIPTQQKPDQVDLLVRKTETKIANTCNNGQNEEDLIKEAIKTVIIESLNVEANSVNGETVMEAKEAVTEGP